MTTQNDFRAFASASFANVITQAVYLADADGWRIRGFDAGAGKTKSAWYNKSMRQGSFIAAGIAAFMEGQGIAALDNGSVDAFKAGLQAAIASMISQLILPTGAVVPYGGGVIPIKFRACGAQIGAKATFARLYSVIGDRYNTGGEGPANFRFPDIRGRQIAGLDNMGGTAAGRLTAATRVGGWNALGDAGGEIEHLLTLLEAAAHDHNGAFVHDHHPPAIGFAPDTPQEPMPGSFLTNNFDYAAHVGDPATYAAQVTDDQLTGATIGDTTTGGGAHNNVQPGLGLYYLIRI